MKVGKVIHFKMPILETGKMLRIKQGRLNDILANMNKNGFNEQGLVDWLINLREIEKIAIFTTINDAYVFNKKNKKTNIGVYSLIILTEYKRAFIEEGIWVINGITNYANHLKIDEDRVIEYRKEFK